MQVSVPIVSNDCCKSMFLRAGRHEFIPEIFLCAGHETGGQDSCQVSKSSLSLCKFSVQKSATTSFYNNLSSVLLHEGKETGNLVDRHSVYAFWDMTKASTLDYLNRYSLLLFYFLGMQITIPDNFDFEKLPEEVFLLTPSNIISVYVRSYSFSKQHTLITIWERTAE
jgi:hypothetical protein